ncbi:MAG: outer membrane beta-barrel protein [Capnocytophaga sp.]|nr:outer membrane beta-barrel protein [Capnocytophaga sp.]
MKAKLQVIILFIFIVGISNAQNFEVATKFGYVRSKLELLSDGYPVGTYNYKSNVYISFPLEYHLNRFFSLQAEVEVAGLGGRDLIINNQLSDLNLITVYLPLGMKFYPIRNRLSLSLGANLGVNTSAIAELDGEKVQVYNYINRNNHSLFLGGELKIAQTFIIEAKVNTGLTNIDKKKEVSLKSLFWQIGVGYIFHKF